jgi:hypothetical protein
VKSRRQELQEELKAELRRSAEALFAPNTKSASHLPTAMLRQALRIGFSDTSFAIILNHTPCQCEDLWSILIGIDRVSIVEVPRGHAVDVGAVSIEVVAREAYEKKRLGKQTRRKLKAATELMREKVDA